MLKINPFLKTLHLIPDHVIQRMATRNFDMNNTEMCICGWAIRESLSDIVEKDAYNIDIYDDYNKVINYDSVNTPDRCVGLFGGTYEEWNDIFGGVTEANIFPEIEEAFVTRILETV